MEIIVNPFQFQLTTSGVHISEASYYVNQLTLCEAAAKDVLTGRINVNDYLDQLEEAELDMDEFLEPVINGDNYG